MLHKMEVVIEDQGMNPEQLYKAVMGGEQVECVVPVWTLRFGFSRRLAAIVRKEDDRIVMRGVTGEHKLNAAAWATDAERLHAHWQGFKMNATAKVKSSLEGC